MFEDYIKRVNKAFGEYEYAMIRLGFAWDRVAYERKTEAEHWEECEEEFNNVKLHQCKIVNNLRELKHKYGQE